MTTTTQAIQQTQHEDEGIKTFRECLAKQPNPIATLYPYVEFIDKDIYDVYDACINLSDVEQKRIWGASDGHYVLRTVRGSCDAMVLSMDTIRNHIVQRRWVASVDSSSYY